MSLEKDIIKKYGVGIMVPASFVLEVPKVIIPVGPYLDLALNGGVPEGSWFLVSGPPKSGKMQPYDAKILTPNGFKKLGDITVGDIVCTPDAKFTKVNEVHEFGLKDVYKVTFADGHSTECGLEHLWELSNKDRKTLSVLSLEEFKDNLLNSNGRPKWAVKTSLCEFESQNVPMDPYLAGILIGDGCIVKSIRFSTADEEILQNVRKIIDNSYTLKKVGQSKYDYAISKPKAENENIYIQALRDLKLLGLKSKDKFIPDVYKYNTKEVRLAILQGLMDTDGYCGANGHCIFYSSSERLINDVKELVFSLGGIATVKDKVTRCNGKLFNTYVCYIRYNNCSELFRLSRKKNRTKVRTKKPLTRKITKVELIGQKECRCIKLASSDGLYITDNFIVTHNTTTVMQFCANAQSLGKKVFYVDAEGRFKPMNLQVHNMQPNNMTVIRSTQDRQYTGEEFLTIVTQIIKDKENVGCVIVIDSASALCPADEINEEVSGSKRSSNPKILSNFCKKMAGIVPVMNTTVVIIQHLIANTSGYGAPWMEDGGVKAQYQADVKIRSKAGKKWLDGEKQIGQTVEWDVVTSALGPPGTKVESYIRYGYGIDDITENCLLASDLGIINKAGAWYSLPDGKKFQGQEKLYQFLKENPTELETIKTKVKEFKI